MYVRIHACKYACMYICMYACSLACTREAEEGRTDKLTSHRKHNKKAQKSPLVRPDE
jgi:hypothetical protein